MSGEKLASGVKHADNIAPCLYGGITLIRAIHPLDIVRGLECGADNYVTKPYDPEHLLARVRNVVDRPKLRRVGRHGRDARQDQLLAGAQRQG